MKKKMVTALLAVSMLAGLSAVNVMAADDDTITVGFSQVGAESDWRTANTESMKSTFSEDNGYELIFDDAQQKQENQLTAIRNFIQQEVDYIVLAPVTETGWDTVLQEAKDAGIPVIIVDRMVDVSDDSLYTAWVGSNFKLEGQKAMAWLDAYLEAKGRGDEEGTGPRAFRFIVEATVVVLVGIQRRRQQARPGANVHLIKGLDDCRRTQGEVVVEPLGPVVIGLVRTAVGPQHPDRHAPGTGTCEGIEGIHLEAPAGQCAAILQLPFAGSAVARIHD